MRKIYSIFSLLLVLLCTTGTAMAQTSITSLDEAVEGTAYVVQSARGYLVYAPEHNAEQSWCSNNSNYTVTVDENAGNNQWTFLKSAKGNYYMLNVGSGKFIYTNGSLTAMTDTPTGSGFDFVASTGDTKDTYPVNLSFGGSLINMHTSTPTTITVYNWANDQGNMMSVRAVGTVATETISSAKEAIVAYEQTLPTYVTTLDGLSNDKVYYVRNPRGDWAWDPSFGGTIPAGNSHYAEGTVYSGENIIVNTKHSGVSSDLSDENLQFAFLKSNSGKYYAYSVGAKKFLSVSEAYANYNGVALTETPVTSKTEILSGTRGKSYPWVLAFGGKQVGVSQAYIAVGGVITFWNDLSDEGNCVAFEEAADFDATEVLAAIEEFEAGLSTEATVSPVSGQYDEIPTTITITADKELGEVEYIRLSTLVTGMRGAFLEEDPDNYQIEGNKITINIPAEYLPYSPYATLAISLKDVDGRGVALSELEQGISLEYTTVISPDYYEASTITPAEGTVEKLDNFLITMLNPQVGEGGDMPGGFDTTKEITLTNAEGTTVATGTIDFDPEDMWSENVYVELSETITEAGTYTLTIPAATIYNGLYDEFADDKGVEMGAIYNPELTFTFTIEASEAPALATVDPAPGKYDALPTAITITAAKNIKEVESIWFRTATTGWGRGVAIEEDGYTIDGNKLTISVPEEYLSYSEYLSLSIVAYDEDGATIINDAAIEGGISLDYETDITPDYFVCTEITPAEGEVTSLEKFNVIFESLAMEGDFIGGFDTTKKITLTDADNNVVAEATIEQTEEMEWTGEALITLDKVITAAGTYTLNIPAALAYDFMYAPTAEDFGVEFGAIYNPAQSFTFTIKASTGIAGATLDAANAEVYTTGGVRVANSTKNLPKGVYIVNGKKVLVK